MVTRYATIAGATAAEIEVKRSRFLCELAPVSTQDAARAVVERARKEHWDARHHCSAFVLGPDSSVRRSNDDGEPSGTAGMPMLDVLTGAGLSDVVAVVTRWFGGTLLGTGGLVRAYSDAVREAVSGVRRVTFEECLELSTPIDVRDVGRVENALRAAGLEVTAVDYVTHAAVSRAAVTVAVPEDAHAGAAALLAELTSGGAVFDTLGTVWVRRS